MVKRLERADVGEDFWSLTTPGATPVLTRKYSNTPIARYCSRGGGLKTARSLRGCFDGRTNQVPP